MPFERDSVALGAPDAPAGREQQSGGGKIGR